jgi:biopolymer transport protein ExbB
MKKHIKLISTAFFVLLAIIVFAQDDSTAANPKELTNQVSAFEFLLKGGIFLIPIAILLFYTLVVIVERYRYIRRNTKYNAQLLQEIKSGLEADSFDRVLDTVNRDQSAFGSVLKEGVLTVGYPISEIESNMEKMANIEIGKMERNVSHLGLVAGIAPTLGFIGTISGVIKIFYSISITENVSIGNISGGLYEKMISSGAGLVVGIIAFAGYHLLNAMIDNYALAIQKVNLDFIKLIQLPKYGNKAK